MNMEIVSGSYPAREAIDLISSIVGEKVRFQEDRIEPCMNEEDIEMRERSIRYLQRDLSVMRCALQGVEGRM
jgi:hypothetical protein